MKSNASENKLHNLRDLVVRTAQLFPDTEFFLCDDERFPSVSGSRLLSICRRVPAVVGDHFHVAIIGPNSAAWIAAYFALLSSGHVVVPIHFGLKRDEIRNCILQADCELVLYDEALADDAEALISEIPGLSATELHDFIEDLEKSPETEWRELDDDEPAAMYFTSGTTARSRCVVLTHRNMASQADALMSVIPLSENDTGLSILPLSHTFEMMTYVVGALHCGGTLYINESLRTVKANLLRCRPTILVVVPLILQSLKKEILRTAEKQGKTGQLKRGIEVSGQLQRIGIHAGRQLFKEIHQSFGGRLNTIVCGGAALDPELIRFFRALDIEILQGYGITECSPVVSVNNWSMNRPGSIGRPLPCCEVRLIDGEICVRGDSVSPGYYRDDESNAASYHDGWFHTGDLGYEDKDGYLYFTGRLKNLIILSNGENVSPEELEEYIYRIDGVRDVIVYENDGKITAEIYADPDAIPDKAAAWKAISNINRSVATYKQIGDIIIRDKAFEKTSTNKIKRYRSDQALTQ